jgi:hypothetical protein
VDPRAWSRICRNHHPLPHSVSSQSFSESPLLFHHPPRRLPSRSSHSSFPSLVPVRRR